MNRIQGCNIFLLLADGKSPQHLGANNSKEVNSVKKADKPCVVIHVHVHGDNNKVSLNENRSHVPAVAIKVIIAALVAVAVLAVFFCCPDQLPDFVRSIGEVINS